MHSFNKYFLTTYHIPNTVLNDGGKSMNKILPTLEKLSSSWKLENTYTHTHTNKIVIGYNNCMKKNNKGLNRRWHILGKLPEFTTYYQKVTIFELHRVDY